MIKTWLLIAVATAHGAANPEFATLRQRFETDARPLLERFCFDCHAGETTEADIDLGAFDSLANVRRQPKTWQKVLHILETGQMPPKDADQPSDREHKILMTWVREYLTVEAAAQAGDPGKVELRRLTNAEYTYTTQDLTGVDSLDPTREFPVDGAAGEGFTNVGSGQGMSPALVQKYLDAAKQVAEHAVLLPDGLGFSAYTTRRDQTSQLLARIQAFYRQFTEDGGGSAVDLQGIRFETNQGGRLPLEKYLTATLVERAALTDGTKTTDVVARERALNPRYLATLWDALARGPDSEPSLLIDAWRRRWRRADPNDGPALAAEIAEAQNVLWKFNSIGHIGLESGPKSWMEAVTPVATQQTLRFRLPDKPPSSDLVLYLTASDLGDGNESDFVILERPRIEFQPDRALAPVLLRDLRQRTRQIEAAIAAELPRTGLYLDAVAALQTSANSPEAVAADRRLNLPLLARWVELAGLGQRASREITGLFAEKVERVQGYETVNGWGSPQTPVLLTNRSHDPIRLGTLTVPAHGVTVHPSPRLESVVAWLSPFDGNVKIEGTVADADANCGNGVAWRIEMLSAAGRTQLAGGAIDNGGQARFQPTAVDVRRDDVISLVVNARDGNHTCDTTHVAWKLTESGGENRVWDLATDVVDHVLAGNPLADSHGNPKIWHFAAVERGPQPESPIPPGSALARWRTAVVDSRPADEIRRLAASVQHVLTAGDTELLDESDKILRRLLTDWQGPLGWLTWSTETAAVAADADGVYGLDPAWFGKHPDGSPLDPASLCVQAPRAIELRLPAGLASGGEFVATATLLPAAGQAGSVQVRLLAEKPEPLELSLSEPILVASDSPAQQRIEAAWKEFRELFPPALCYARIVPVDQVVTLVLYHREDEHLKRLMLDDAQAAELDRLWDQLTFVSHEPLELAVAFEQIAEFATQDRPDLVTAFAPLRTPINERADAFRRRLLETEPVHVDAVLEFAGRAWRRPLTDAEQQDLRALYRRLRDSQMPHEPAIRLTLARVLVAPAFLYKLEQPALAREAAPVSDLELAARLSYFLWSSLPDEELRGVAQAGRLADDPTLLAQTRRMLEHPHARRLAIQFACQWLHVRDFDKHDEKNERLYPEFAELREAMYEETVSFFEDMVRNNGRVLDILEADHTFLNEPLARHYGIEGVSGGDWRAVQGVRARGRGGVLGMATFLASQSGASRTSPILRGNWVYETLLGERLPRPPAGVPQLPDALPDGLTERQLIERHSSDPACARCHARIDPYGFALEQYDAIGRRRPQPTDTKTTLIDGTEIEGLEGLREYLANDLRGAFVRQFCRKLLGYALGREVQLSDEPLLEAMQTNLEASDFRFHSAVETIVTSPQFRRIRSRSMEEDGE